MENKDISHITNSLIMENFFRNNKNKPEKGYTFTFWQEDPSIYSFSKLQKGIPRKGEVIQLPNKEWEDIRKEVTNYKCYNDGSCRIRDYFYSLEFNNDKTHVIGCQSLDSIYKYHYWRTRTSKKDYSNMTKLHAKYKGFTCKYFIFPNDK